MGRFNGLNYLSHPYLGSHTTSYTDWSREHTPGHQYYSGGHYPHDAAYCPRSHGHHSSSRKSSSKTPDTTLGSSDKRSSSKRDSSEMMYHRGSVSPHKKSALKNSSSSHSHQALLLNVSGLSSGSNHYDENSRVYHITP